ncbi:MAG: hypothetical protein AAFP85_11565 [Pseudomonadota bacterium]
MSKHILAAAILAMVSATPTLAQQFNGGSVTGQYKQYDDDEFDLESFSFEGGVEIGLGDTFALGGNVSVFEGSAFIEDQVTSATVHAMYMTSPDSAIGLFVSQDVSDFSDSTNYGIEAGAASGATRIEGYYGVAEVDAFSDVDYTMAGFMFEVAFGNGFAAGLHYESYTVEDGVTVLATSDDEDLTIADTAVFLNYTIQGGPTLYAEYGEIEATFSNDGTDFIFENELEYFAIGARYALGREGGNIFSDRTLIGFGG